MCLKITLTILSIELCHEISSTEQNQNLGWLYLKYASPLKPHHQSFTVSGRTIGVSFKENATY